MVIFERCDPALRTCKSEADIDKWMQFKYIITLENEKKFQTHARLRYRDADLGSLEHQVVHCVVLAEDRVPLDDSALLARSE